MLSVLWSVSETGTDITLCLANVNFLRKKKFFCVLYTLLVYFLNHGSFVKEVGTILRTEAKIFSRVAFERMSGRRKKKFFFCKSKTQKTLLQKEFVLEADQSAHKVCRHSKKDLRLSTILKENMES